jgi:hypothetical protein
MINELSFHRDEHCPVCASVILKSAALNPCAETDLTDLIRKAVHHNWHLTHAPERVPSPRTGLTRSDIRGGPPRWLSKRSK